MAGKELLLVCASLNVTDLQAVKLKIIVPPFTRILALVCFYRNYLTKPIFSLQIPTLYTRPAYSWKMLTNSAFSVHTIVWQALPCPRCVHCHGRLSRCCDNIWTSKAVDSIFQSFFLVFLSWVVGVMTSNVYVCAIALDRWALMVNRGDVGIESSLMLNIKTGPEYQLFSLCCTMVVFGG